MGKKTSTDNEMLPEKFARLRRQAEERIAQWPNFASSAHTDLQVVIHELKIHLAELEIQNEELKLAMKEMVSQQDKDVMIHDFGPMKEKTGKNNREYHRAQARYDEAPESVNAAGEIKRESSVPHQA